MANGAEKKAAGIDWEEPVDFEVPLLGTDGREDVIVSVNGETIRFRRGEPVKIKRKFAEVLRQSAREERAAASAAEAAALRSRRPLAEL